MRKTLVSTLVVALLLGWSAVCPARVSAAEELKPVAVVSVASYDELMGDVEMIGKITDRPALVDLVKGLESLVTLGKGLQGVDKAKPCGLVVRIGATIDQSKPLRKQINAVAFVPVTDLDALGESVKGILGKAKKAGEGIWTVGHGIQKIYVTQVGQWAYLALTPKDLVDLPEDPDKWLGDLPANYDLALRLLPANVPEELREFFFDKVRKHAAIELESRMPGEEEDVFAVRKKVGGYVLERVLTWAEDVDQLTLGWSLDHEAETAHLDVSVTAVAGSKTAKELAALADTKTRFSGFQVPGAAVTGNWACTIASDDVDQINAVVKLIRKKIIEEIEDLPEDRAKVASKLAREMFDVIEATVQTGRVDGGMAVVLEPEAVTLAAGKSIAEGRKLEKVVKEVAKILAQENPIVDVWVKFDTDQLDDVRFHTVSIPLPPNDDRAKIAKLIGEKLVVVLGIGEQSVYVAAGRNPIKMLKKVIEKSKAAGPQKTPPIDFSLALKPVAEFVAEVGEGRDRERAALAAELLADCQGKDHINFVAMPIERGIRFRLEAESGVVKLVGKIAAMAGDRMAELIPTAAAEF